MRTTLQIDDHLMRQAKKLAAETGRSLTAVVEDALRALLFRAEARNAAEKKRFVLPTFDSGGVMPGVDLDNSAALLDIMEEGDAPF
jgi:hypothetical protein